jgi:hypothetical protein
VADPLIPINVNGSLAQVVSLINQNFSQVQGSSVTRIYNDNTGTPAIIEGVLPDGTTGIVIAKSGYNVTTLFS